MIPSNACGFSVILRTLLLPLVISIILYVVWRGNGGAPVMDGRIAAILVGVAITFTLQNGLDTRWYVSVPAGFIGYFAARFIGWTINRRQRDSRAKQRDPIVK